MGVVECWKKKCKLEEEVGEFICIYVEFKENLKLFKFEKCKGMAGMMECSNRVCNWDNEDGDLICNDVSLIYELGIVYWACKEVNGERLCTKENKKTWNEVQVKEKKDE